MRFQVGYGTVRVTIPAKKQTHERGEKGRQPLIQMKMGQRAERQPLVSIETGTKEQAAVMLLLLLPLITTQTYDVIKTQTYDVSIEN